MFEADEAPNEVLVEDRMLTADSTFTLRRNKKRNGTEENKLEKQMIKLKYGTHLYCY